MNGASVNSTRSTRRTIHSVDVKRSDLRAFSNAVDRIYDGELDLLLIRGAFPGERVVAAAENLRSADRDWFRPNMAIPGMDIQLLGVPGFPTATAPRGPEIETYLAGGAQYRSMIDALFGPGFSPAQRFEEILGALSMGRSIERPRTPDGRSFPPFTLRSLPEGQSIIVHNDYLFGLPLYAHLSKELDTRTLVSFFVLIQKPTQGGRLVLFDLTQGDEVPLTAEGHPDQKMIEEHYGCYEFEPGPGDMIVFPAGRFFHKVEPVRGSFPRVTLGGLFALSQDTQRVLYWG